MGFAVAFPLIFLVACSQKGLFISSPYNYYNKLWGCVG
jgi:hypothetical protein